MATVAYSIAVNQIYKLLNIQKRSMLVVTDNPEPDLEHDEQQSPPPVRHAVRARRLQARDPTAPRNVRLLPIHS